MGIGNQHPQKNSVATTKLEISVATLNRQILGLDFVHGRGCDTGYFDGKTDTRL
jgi:hypothetical protein